MTNNNAAVYLDYNASAPLLPAVREAMLASMTAPPGNPSSQHQFGREARRRLEEARERIAACLGARPEEIVFTASATEANNLALHGCVAAAGDRALQSGIALSRGEHPCLTEAAAALGRRNIPIHWINLRNDGGLDEASLAAAADARPMMMSVQMANHETGAVHDIASLSERCRNDGILVHTDAVQAAGRLPVNVQALGVDMMTLSAHKIGGPTGAGLLYVKRGTALRPLLRGGPQERGLRAGTENVTAVVGFATALEHAVSTQASETGRLRALRDEFWNRLQAALPDLRRHGTPATESTPSLCNTLSLSVPGLRNELVLIQLDLRGVCVSTGSACASGAAAPSPVLQAMGKTEDDLRSALRVSIGAETTTDALRRAAEIFIETVATLRARRGAAPA